MIMMPHRLDLLTRAHHEYAYGSLFSAIEQNDISIWHCLVYEFGDSSCVHSDEVYPKCGVPLIDYAVF